MFVEGISDRVALQTLAERRGRDLHADGVAIVPIGGAQALGRFLDPMSDVCVAGLCDAAEESSYRRALERAGFGTDLSRGDLERLGFYVCDADLEDELIRALGADGVVDVVREHGDLGPFITFQKQPEWRGRPTARQLHRFMGSGGRRKIRYARILEDEVANQTRSLMSALGATASAERNLRLVMEAVPDAITVVDRDGHVLDENTAGRTLVNAFPGGALEGIGNRSAFGWVEGTASRIARENLIAAFDGELRRFEVPFQRPDGNEGTAHVLLAPVREGGRIPKVLVLVRDITEQRRTQAQLQQAEKLAAMGQLVSGVAHEINNPAAIISGFAQTLLLDQMTPDQRETMQMMYDEATRIGRITSNLLAFARAGSKERTLVELNDTVRRTFALRSYHLTTLNITVNLELDDANPKAWANGSEVQQMLLNLLINAEQALTTIPPPGRRGITIRTVTAAEDGVQLQVADTGPGIPPDIQEKIFDPFFTTKPEGMGTGLGLSICYGIVHDHGGRIGVHSVPGHGATFTISLPRDARQRQRTTPPPMEIPEAAREPEGAGALSVLLVDDEEGLRRAVTTFLKRRGMNVLAVEDGSDALRALRRGRFDVIVSDVRMPGMSGAEFLQGLRREHPAMVNRLIFTTGDRFATDTSSLLRDAGVPSLAKPYDFAKLESVLREVALAAKTST